MNAPLADNAPILGIESSCDETAAAVVLGGRNVRSNVVASQHDLHAKFGGVVPEIASRAHIQRMLPVIDQALGEAGVEAEDLAAIAVGHRPGLIGSLLVGVSAAKALAWSLSKPLVGVDHVAAHLWAGALDRDPIPYPALGLVVSGGHTSLYTLNGALAIERLGQTIDDAVGEAYDKVAAILNLGFPGGPAVDKLATQGDPKAIRFPRTLLDGDSLDFSFSGIKTAVLYNVRGKPQGRGRDAAFERDASALSDQAKADVAASFQAAAVDVLLKKMDRAIAHLTHQGQPPQALIIGGGVSANSALRSRSEGFAEERGLELRLPKMGYCIDNAAMIAGLGYEHVAAGRLADMHLGAAAVSEI